MRYRRSSWVWVSTRDGGVIGGHALSGSGVQSAANIFDRDTGKVRCDRRDITGGDIVELWALKGAGQVDAVRAVRRRVMRGRVVRVVVPMAVCGEGRGVRRDLEHANGCDGGVWDGMGRVCEPGMLMRMRMRVGRCLRREGVVQLPAPPRVYIPKRPPAHPDMSPRKAGGTKDPSKKEGPLSCPSWQLMRASRAPCLFCVARAPDPRRRLSRRRAKSAPHPPPGKLDYLPPRHPGPDARVIVRRCRDRRSLAAPSAHGL